MQGIISAVRRNSLAENAGIKAGEKLCAVNGVSVHDIIAVYYRIKLFSCRRTDCIDD